MINNSVRFVPVQQFGKLVRGFSCFVDLFYERGIFAPDNIKFVIYQDTFVFEKLNIGFTEKLIHTGIFYI